MNPIPEFALICSATTSPRMLYAIASRRPISPPGSAPGSTTRVSMRQRLTPAARAISISRGSTFRIAPNRLM
jgi:hypothetical protein